MRQRPLQKPNRGVLKCLNILSLVLFFAELVPATFGAADDGEDQTGGASGSGGGIGHSGLGPTSPNDDSLGGVGGGGGGRVIFLSF